MLKRYPEFLQFYLKLNLSYIQSIKAEFLNLGSVQPLEFDDSLRGTTETIAKKNFMYWFLLVTARRDLLAKKRFHKSSSNILVLWLKVFALIDYFR